MPGALFPIVQVRPGEAFRDESMGTKRKFWCRHADGTHWLFKFAREGTGEHWAEKVAAHVGLALGVPVAQVELAECEGRAGSLSLSFVQSMPLVHGNEVLQEIDETYPTTRIRGVRQHSVPSVLAALESTEPPFVADGLASGADWFVGYLLLDAVILNSDRHHENWGVLQLDDGKRRLAPSYDHASGLGHELTDDIRTGRLHTSDTRYSVAHYVARAGSGLFGDSSAKKPLHPVDAFVRAAELRPRAGANWLARLGEVGDDHWTRLLDQVPSAAISEPARRFALEILRLATQRLLATPSSSRP